MSVLSVLSVILRGDASQFSATMQRAGKTSNSLTGSLANLSKTASLLKGAFAAVAGSKVVTSLASTVTTTLSAIEASDNFAKRIRVSYNELETLRHAADRLDVDVETLDASLQKMSVTIGNAKFGESGAIQALKKIGVGVNELQSLNGEGAFLKIISAINKVPDPLQRAAAVQGIFGRGAADLGNLLDLTAEKMAGYRTEADKLHKTLSDTERTQALRAQDNVEQAGRILEAGKRKATILASEMIVNGYSFYKPTPAGVPKFTQEQKDARRRERELMARGGTLERMPWPEKFTVAGRDTPIKDAIERFTGVTAPVAAKGLQGIYGGLQANALKESGKFWAAVTGGFAKTVGDMTISEAAKATTTKREPRTDLAPGAALFSAEDARLQANIRLRSMTKQDKSLSEQEKLNKAMDDSRKTLKQILDVLKIPAVVYQEP